MAALSDRAVSAVDQIEALPDQEKKAAVDSVMRANADLFPVNDTDRTKLWITLLVGLFVIAALALVASVVLTLSSSDSSALVAVVSAVVAGVIGLFSKSPTS